MSPRRLLSMAGGAALDGAGLFRGGGDEARAVAVPPEARLLSSLGRIDYEDATAVSAAGLPVRNAEAWARASLEGAPPDAQAALDRGWKWLGVRRGSPHDPTRVLGWEIRSRSREHLVLAADSWLGMRAQVLFFRLGETVLVATFVKMSNRLARAIWGAVAPGHRRVVATLLADAVRRERLPHGPEQRASVGARSARPHSSARSI